MMESDPICFAKFTKDAPLFPPQTPPSILGNATQPRPPPSSKTGFSRWRQGTRSKPRRKRGPAPTTNTYSLRRRPFARCVCVCARSWMCYDVMIGKLEAPSWQGAPTSSGRKCDGQKRKKSGRSCVEVRQRVCGARREAQGGLFVLCVAGAALRQNLGQMATGLCLFSEPRC